MTFDVKACGARGGSIELLIELADYFQVSLDYLILGRGGRTDEGGMIYYGTGQTKR